MRLITKKLPPKDEPATLKLVAEEGENNGLNANFTRRYVTYYPAKYPILPCIRLVGLLATKATSRRSAVPVSLVHILYMRLPLEHVRGWNLRKTSGSTSLAI
jgi:hypothetical protein